MSAKLILCNGARGPGDRARLDLSLTINLEPFGLVRRVCIGKGFAELN
jgi:hypothetical protein